MTVNPAAALRPFLLALVFTLSACGAPDGEKGDRPTADGGATSPVAGGIEIIDPVDKSAPVSRSTLDTLPETADASPLACAADIGAKAAERLARACRNASPATHPPCYVSNSCAVMADEIARSCALFDGKGTPMAECQPEPKSAEAAAAVVRLYYSALNARDYNVAWGQWGEEGPPDQSLPQFSAGFANTQSTKVTIGELETGDAGAGSIYQAVPVTVDAVSKTGERQRFTGTYTLRRVNDVDGATLAQRRWHIDSAKLTPIK